MSIHQFVSLRQRWRVLLVWLSASFMGLAVAWFVVRQPKFGLLIGFSLLSVFALVIAVKAKSLLFYFYLFALGWGPILQGVMGLATFRIDEALLPVMAIIYVLLPVLVGKSLLPTVPKSFGYTWGIYLTLTFLAMLGQSLTMGHESWVPLVYLARVFYVTVVFYTIYVLIKQKEQYIQKVMDLFVVISLGISLLGILQWFGIDFVWNFISSCYSRITTSIPGVATSIFGGNPTILGTFLLISISYVFAQLVVSRNKGKRRLFLYISLTILIFCLFLTVAKMAILSLPVLLSFLSVLASRKRIRTFFLASFSLAAVLYLVNVFASHVFVRFSIAWEGSVEGRLVTWGRLKEQFLAGVPTLLFGYGFQERVGVITESQYFYELYYKGTLGLIGYLIFLFGSLLHVLRLFLGAAEGSYEKAIYLGTCGMLAAMAMVGFTYTTIEPERLTEWIFVMLAVAYASAAQQNFVQRRLL
jgi:hypothetical protein